MRRFLTASLCLAAGLALATPARAADVIFLGNSNTAKVEFVTSGTTLTVTLTNQGGDALVPTDVLTAVFFNCTGCGTLTTVSAISSGSTYQGTTFISASGTVVGGEWAYKAGIDAPGPATQGISSTGLGLFASTDRFPGSDLDPPADPNGLNYGIVSGSDNTATANGGLESVPVTQHDVIFTLTCSVTCTNATFGDVVFQYGTSLTEPSFGGTGPGGQNLVPEPTSLLLFGSGLAMTAYRARRKKNQKDS